MRYEIQRVEIWPIVKLVLIISLLFGFFMGLLNAGFVLLVDTMSRTAAHVGFQDVQSFGASFALFVLMFSTVFIAILSTVAAMILTAFYNLIAAWVGGLVVDIEPLETPDSQKTTVG